MTAATRLLLGILIAAAVVAAGLLGYSAFRMLTDDGTAAGSRILGEAQLGGPFALVDGDGRTRTDADFRGRLMLIYFGYTFCPDVCPTELQTMAQAVELLGDDAAKVQPLFITVDPERDTPEVMKAYAENFGAGMIGLTGTPEQVAQAARAYRVYYRKATSESATDYLMDHSSIVYLMGRDGRFLTHFSLGTTPEDMAKSIHKFL